MNRLRPWLKNMFVANPALKFLALLMAVFTFHSIRGVTSEETVLIVPVQAQPTDDHIVLDQQPLSVSVTLRGSREDLKNLDTQDIKAVLKLRGLENGLVPIRARDIRGVSRVRVVKIEPDKASVSMTPAAAPEPAPNRPASAWKAPPARVEIATWRHVPVRVLDREEPSDAFEVDPATVNIVVSGAPESVAPVGSAPPFAYVDALEPGESEARSRPVRIRGDKTPDGVVTIEPASVTVSRRQEEGL